MNPVGADKCDFVVDVGIDASPYAVRVYVTAHCDSKLSDHECGPEQVMTAKTSYTIPDVAGICHVSEKLVISWANQGKLKTSKVNLENCVYREDLILFMKRVGFSTEALETPPTKEDEALKEWMFKNKDMLYQALEHHYYDGACTAEYNEMSFLMARHLEGK